MRLKIFDTCDSSSWDHSKHTSCPSLFRLCDQPGAAQNLSPCFCSIASPISHFFCPLPQVANALSHQRSPEQKHSQSIWSYTWVCFCLIWVFLLLEILLLLLLLKVFCMMRNSKICHSLSVGQCALGSPLHPQCAPYVSAVVLTWALIMWVWLGLWLIFIFLQIEHAFIADDIGKY